MAKSSVKNSTKAVRSPATKPVAKALPAKKRAAVAMKVASRTALPTGKPAATAAKPAKLPKPPTSTKAASHKPPAKPHTNHRSAAPRGGEIATKPLASRSHTARSRPRGEDAVAIGSRTTESLRDKPVKGPKYQPPMPEAVTTDGKPKKNLAGINSRELEHFRDLLLEKRRELVGDMSSMEREALRAGGSNLSSVPVHTADLGTDNYEQEFTLGLVEKDRALLREINAALAKIQSGTYGICEGTGRPIGRPRLEAQPWAKYSIEHARELEQRAGFRR